MLMKNHEPCSLSTILLFGLQKPSTVPAGGSNLQPLSRHPDTLRFRDSPLLLLWRFHTHTLEMEI